MNDEAPSTLPADAGPVQREVGRQEPERASTCGLTECRDKPQCVRCQRIADMDALCDLLPEGAHWGDPLTPDLLRALLPTEGDHTCRFAVWWAHKRKTFTTARQAAWAAWNDARIKTPNARGNATDTARPD